MTPSVLPPVAENGAYYSIRPGDSGPNLVAIVVRLLFPILLWNPAPGVRTPRFFLLCSLRRSGEAWRHYPPPTYHQIEYAEPHLLEDSKLRDHFNNFTDSGLGLPFVLRDALPRGTRFGHLLLGTR